MHRIEEIIQTMEGWATPKKAMALYSLVVTYRPKLSIELGVFAGRSLIALSFGHSEVGGIVYGIDPWVKDASLEGENSKENDEWWSNLDYEKLYRDTMISLIAHDVTRVTNLLRMKSENAVEIFKNSQIDLLHLDGNHSEEKSCLDVSLWCPLIKENGILVFDDTNWPTTIKAQELVKHFGFVELQRVAEEGQEWTIYQKLKA